MKDDGEAVRAQARAERSDDELSRDALLAARRGDRATAERLFVVMAERGLPYARLRALTQAIFPLERHSRGFLTAAEQHRALRTSGRRRP